jgi:hypothetical protein
MKEGLASSKGTDEKDRQKVALVAGSSSGIEYATSLSLLLVDFLYSLAPDTDTFDKSKSS